ncbi:hypothetical protein HanRHA438_Chr10g0441361 [Helianthus annuus]|uniref:Uncharacterized protein n=1 Tax=Helianthus annuus TaxID=4232 RepID=A0A251TIB0_HELAN|nr:hypothetical protein HanXRQr2_Chr10g0428991 [Helianthus annuus]KAJ0513016.1 hypothetical protein HanHA300_Chr10g0352701 [Helianthus annuus]KAJ0520728.1 hypothetical protein HanIR_Chr10g0462641 [Helianthus annuus]KAJ0529136.1 hypothetical protein HanHA89_Chr10g0374351 [Helianthus annuus]KAJ0696016.1 hypothetical protein HanLR1_Chr10g0352171 [Helianthus annuus]
MVVSVVVTTKMLIRRLQQRWCLRSFAVAMASTAATVKVRRSRRGSRQLQRGSGEGQDNRSRVACLGSHQIDHVLEQLSPEVVKRV